MQNWDAPQPVDIEFEISAPSETEVYLDNTYFQSQHLRFGINPQQGMNAPRYSQKPKGENSFAENLLIERPQYTVSYNGETNIANWASWQVNHSWIFGDWWPTLTGVFKVNARDFQPDQTLPPEFYQVQKNDYGGDPKGRIVDGVTSIQGHLVPVADRDRNTDPDRPKQKSKDNQSISLLSNIVPQETKHNGSGFWAKIESYTRKFVQQGKEVYVIAGTHGAKASEFEPRTGESVVVTEYLWRVLLVLDEPGADVNENTYTVGFWTENRIPTRSEKDWNKNENWRQDTSIVKTVNFIEQQTGYNFFSNVPQEIQEKIEENKAIYFTGVIPPDFTPTVS